MGGRNIINLNGRLFGRLTVRRRSGSDRWGNATWECVCSCGNVLPAVPGRALRTGNTTSCGCYAAEVGAAALRKYLAEHPDAHIRGGEAFARKMARRRKKS